MNKPTFVSLPLATGLKWSGAGWRYEEKMDGRWHEQVLLGCHLVGEKMPDGRFIAFDILRFHGTDCRTFHLSERLPLLNVLGLLRPPSQLDYGPEFLRGVLARGGEGVVRKRLDQPYGAPWEKCKRSQVFYCRVTDLDPFRGSAILEDRDSGEKRGKLALHSKFEQVHVGSILKVEAYGLTARGLLREARPDHDAPGSYLVSP